MSFELLWQGGSSGLGHVLLGDLVPLCCSRVSRNSDEKLRTKTHMGGSLMLGRKKEVKSGRCLVVMDGGNGRNVGTALLTGASQAGHAF